MKQYIDSAAYKAGLFTLSLRWVIGWTYFSAFWRRLILDNKLIPEEAGYIGEKFNHFLPNALGIKPIIEYLVSNPEALQISMVTFTIVEAIVGLFIILGLFTRLMSIGVFFFGNGYTFGVRLAWNNLFGRMANRCVGCGKWFCLISDWKRCLFVG